MSGGANREQMRNNRLICDCGHLRRHHFMNSGCCEMCGCTWWYPNIEWIRAQQIHVLPTNDVKRHTENELCGCLPVSKGGGRLIVHNSYDGRELLEAKTSNNM